MMNNMVLAMTWFDGIYHTDTFSLIFFLTVFTFAIMYDILRFMAFPRKGDLLW